MLPMRRLHERISSRRNPWAPTGDYFIVEAPSSPRSYESGAERRRKRKRRRKRRRRRGRRHREKEARGRACEKESARPGEEEARPLRPLSSFEVHERLRRTKRRRAGYSLPFLLSRGVLPFPVEARNGEPLHGPFTITIIVDGDRQKERRADARQREVGKKRTPLSSPLPPLSLIAS